MKKRLLGWMAAWIFLLGMAVLTIPDLFCRRTYNVLVRASTKKRRQTEAHWQLSWARVYNRLMHWLLGIAMPIRVRGEIPEGKPCILVANHRTVLDHLLIAMVAHKLGLWDLRWVLKHQMRRAPVVGGSFHRSGSAFVSRQGEEADKDAIRGMARLAREDGASVAIYPEGTRHHGVPQEEGLYLMLRNPKRGGLQVLLDELPNYDVVFVCLNWRGLRGGKTMWDGDGLIGIRGAVVVWRLVRVPGDEAENILDEGWTRMDSILSPSASEIVRALS